MDLQERQAPLKQHYRDDADAAVITLHAAADGSEALSCSVDIGHAIYEAQAHAGVGGEGTAACSGDLLLGALAACSRITCMMCATSAGIPVSSVVVHAEGDLDLRGTLGISRDAPVGFTDIRLRFDIDAPDATERQLSMLKRLTEQYCVVMQTLRKPPAINVSWQQQT